MRNRTAYLSHPTPHSHTAYIDTYRHTDVYIPLYISILIHSFSRPTACPCRTNIFSLVIGRDIFLQSGTPEFFRYRRESSPRETTVWLLMITLQESFGSLFGMAMGGKRSIRGWRVGGRGEMDSERGKLFGKGITTATHIPQPWLTELSNYKNCSRNQPNLYGGDILDLPSTCTHSTVYLRYH